MRRDVVNALTRVRRDLRFRLADGYRALLSSRFGVLAAIAAGVLDRGVALLVVTRRARRGRVPTAAGATVVRAAVTGGHELSLTVRDAPAGADTVVLRYGTTEYALDTTSRRGELLRLVASLPDDVCDGTERTVALAASGRAHDLVVVDPAALATRLGPSRRPARPEPESDDWPPRVLLRDGRLVLRAKAPATVGVEHAVEVGVRSVTVTWRSVAPAALVLVADHAERTVPATLDAGTARAVVDLAELGDAEATWFAFVGGEPLVLPRGTFPPLDHTGRPHRVPLPAHGGGSARAAEVGHSPDNQLVVRIGNLAPVAR